jgi:hypothetical protein
MIKFKIRSKDVKCTEEVLPKEKEDMEPVMYFGFQLRLWDTASYRLIFFAF